MSRRDSEIHRKSNKNIYENLVTNLSFVLLSFACYSSCFVYYLFFNVYNYVLQNKSLKKFKAEFKWEILVRVKKYNISYWIYK